MDLTSDNIRRLLHELDQWLAFEDCQPVDWVVCGGAALGLQGLLDRPTQDIDVLGRWDNGILDVTDIELIGPDVNACIARVADAHPELAGLGRNWVNCGPRNLAEEGLPEGFADRMCKLSVGAKLTLHLLGRKDLLALKLYAAADDHGPRQAVHYADLASMAPTFDELDFAVDWILTRSDFEVKRIAVKDVLRRLDHEDLAYYV